MPRMKPDVFEEFLRQPHVGVISTLRKDGMPYTVPIWWLWKDGAVWITGTYSRVWCQQLLKDPRASLCIEALTPVSGHVGFDGTCKAFERPDFDIWPISRELAEKYVGRGNPANAEAGMDSMRRNDLGQVKGGARIGQEGRERFARAAASIQFDSQKYLNQFAGASYGAIKNAILPGEPANPLGSDMTQQQLLKALLLDPMYQLK